MKSFVTDGQNDRLTNRRFYIPPPLAGYKKAFTKNIRKHKKGSNNLYACCQDKSIKMHQINCLAKYCSIIFAYYKDMS